MARREQARAEAAFLRGEVGVDGAAVEDQKDVAEVERDRAREQLLRGRTWLGRELLTWLLWRSESGDPVTELDGTGVVVLFTGRVVLRGVQGDVTELSARGAMASYAPEVKRALDAGLLVHQARMRLEHGEKVYEATLDAEFLDVRAAKLPQLLAEEEDDRLLERIYLTEQLSSLLDALASAFFEERAAKAWSKKTVPAMKAWMKGADGAAAAALRSA